jgi:hypothetical protein
VSTNPACSIVISLNKEFWLTLGKAEWIQALLPLLARYSLVAPELSQLILFNFSSQGPRDAHCICCG